MAARYTYNNRREYCFTDLEVGDWFFVKERPYLKIKTILTENGDDFNCVDIEGQPATFTNNHVVEKVITNIQFDTL